MNIPERAKNIITNPSIEWLRINSENNNLQQLITAYLIPLSLIGVVTNFIGWGFVGSSAMGIHIVSISWGIARAAEYIIQVVFSTIITTYIIDALAPTFQSERNLNRSAQLVIYSYTPALLGAIFRVIPVLGFLSFLCSLYGLYLIYAGLHIIKKTPEEQRIAYIVVSVLVLIAVYVIMGLIVWAIIGGLLGLTEYHWY